MPCKHLTKTVKLLPPKSGGPALREGYTIPMCRLGREPPISRYARCQKASTNGPCPFWCGTLPDPAFSSQENDQ